MHILAQILRKAPESNRIRTRALRVKVYHKVIGVWRIVVVTRLFGDQKSAAKWERK